MNAKNKAVSKVQSVTGSKSDSKWKKKKKKHEKGTGLNPTALN